MSLFDHVAYTLEIDSKHLDTNERFTFQLRTHVLKCLKKKIKAWRTQEFINKLTELISEQK